MQHAFFAVCLILTHIQKHTDEVPFKKKGFFYYNHMAALMPNHVMTHTFHTSQQSFANQAFATGRNITTPCDTGTGWVVTQVTTSKLHH